MSKKQTYKNKAATRAQKDVSAIRLYVSNYKLLIYSKSKEYNKEYIYNKFLKNMDILELGLLNEQTFQISVLQSGISTSETSVQSLPSPSFNQKIQNKTKTLKYKSVGCRATSDVLEREVMIWFTLKGIHEGFPQQLLQDQSLVHRRQINSRLQRNSCYKPSFQLEKRVGYKLHVFV